MSGAVATKEAVLVGSVELARAAAQEVAESPELVGEHLGAVLEGERVVSHQFATTAPGYRGWHWTVTLARVPRGRTATVSEVELLPGDDAILAAPWVPWSERLQPGDVGPGDVLPFRDDDERLEPGYTATGEDADELAIFELGLGRARVLSPEGRAEATTRWYSGTHGPLSTGAIAATAPCSTCGFLLLMAGSLRTTFGVCANEWSPDDGRVVSMDHGCGAHSETDVAPAPSDWPDSAPLFDELDVELVDHLVADESVADEDAPVQETASAEGETPAEAVAPADDAPVVDPAAETPAEDETPVADAEAPEDPTSV